MYCIVVIIIFKSTVVSKHFIATMIKKITIRDIDHTQGSSTTVIIIYKLPVKWVYNQNTEDRKLFIPTVLPHFSILLDTGWRISTKTCWVDNVSLPDDASDNEMNCAVNMIFI